MQVSLTELDEICLAVYQPVASDSAVVKNGNDDGADVGWLAFEASPCQQFFLRSGAEINWSSMLKLVGPNEMCLSLTCQIDAESPIHSRTIDFFMLEISTSRSSVSLFKPIH